jgi:hypothetical protein
MKETNRLRESARECLKEANTRNSVEDKELFLDAATQSLWIATVLDHMTERRRRFAGGREKISRFAQK